MYFSRKRNIGFAIFVLVFSVVGLWLYASYFERNVWSISIYTGFNPYKFTPHPLTLDAPVLTAEDVKDIKARFVADPFMIQENNKWFMFFEVLNTSTNQGDIALASSENGIDWQYEQVVLDEPFHLSYPYIFKWNNTFYMIPESRDGLAVKLYKAERFPTQWVLVENLIQGDYADPSIVYKDNKWWLFVLRGKDDLALFYSDDILGSWVEHPMSPIIENDRNISRPGGRLLVFDNKMIRYVQDGDPVYGNSVRVFEVDSISTSYYKDHEVLESPLLKASEKGWNSIGMHHIDPHKENNNFWIACVDGKRVEWVFDMKIGAKRLLYKLKY